MPYWLRGTQFRVLRDDLAAILTQGRAIMATLSDISLAVQRQTTVEQSVVALLRQLATQLHDAMDAEDPAALQAVADLIDANTKALSDAVLANTPSAVASATLDTPVPAPADASAPADTSASLVEPPSAPPHDETPPGDAPTSRRKS